MRTLQDVKNNCRVDFGDDGREHWYWQGCQSGGSAFMTAPNFSQDPTGAVTSTQRGCRAVWHILNARPLPKGCVAYAICQERACVNPACIKMGTPAQYGQALRLTGALQTGVNRRLASRRAALAFRKISPDDALAIWHSRASTQDLMRQYGVAKSTINRHKAGQHAGLGGLFSGLLR